MTRRRASRVAEAIRREISTMLQKKEVKDPRIGFVTVVRVEVSNDLREVEVYLTHYGKQSDKDKSLEGLRSATGFIQKEIGDRLRLRLIPNIKFFYDEKLEKAMNVLKIMDSLHSDEK
jgi:ribosome-binding factor A